MGTAAVRERQVSSANLGIREEKLPVWYLRKTETGLAVTLTIQAYKTRE